MYLLVMVASVNRIQTISRSIYAFWRNLDVCQAPPIHRTGSFSGSRRRTRFRPCWSPFLRSPMYRALVRCCPTSGGQRRGRSTRWLLAWPWVASSPISGSRVVSDGPVQAVSDRFSQQTTRLFVFLSGGNPLVSSPNDPVESPTLMGQPLQRACQGGARSSDPLNTGPCSPLRPRAAQKGTDPRFCQGSLSVTL